MAVPGQLPFLVVQDPPALQLNGSFADPPSPLTPGLANSQWAAQEYFLAANQSRSSGLKRTYSHSGRVSISGIRTPSGFEHLDFGADYFGQQSSQQNKRLPRDFEWDVWAQEDTYSYSESSEAQLVPGRVLKRRLGPNETSYYLGSRGDGPQDPLAGVNDM